MFLSLSVYESILGALNEAIVVHSDRIVWLNGQALELLGYDVLEEVLGRCVLDFIAVDQREELTRIYSEIDEKIKVEFDSLEIVRIDGARVIINARSSLHTDFKERFIVTILRPKNAEDTDLKLIAFLQTLRHEVNTPLAVLKGYTELTEDKLIDYFDPEVAKFLIVMKKNIARLENLTAKLMTLESIRDGLEDKVTEP